MQTTYEIKSLLVRAERYPPVAPVPSASKFAAWIYRLSHNPNRESNVKMENEWKSQSKPFTHNDIQDVAKYLSRVRNDEKLLEGWGILYADPCTANLERFVASRLVIGGQELRCRPDAVIRHEPSGEIVIIERKISGKISQFRSQMPTDSWPNIKAQLWCYSWINEWVNAPQITLMADVWRRNHTTDEPTPLPIDKPIWSSKDELWRNYENLFRLYGGQIV
jgi:hypothetical protein